MQPVIALTGITLCTPTVKAMTDFYAGAFGLAVSVTGPDEPPPPGRRASWSCAGRRSAGLPA